MQEVPGLDLAWLIVTGVLAAVGFWLLVTGLVRLARGRFLRGPLRAVLGAAIGALALAIAGVGLNLRTWHALDYEAPVAQLAFEQVGPRQYQALLRTAEGGEALYVVHGDEWQLDARVLKWKGVGALLGLEPRYRLERFGGRYARVVDEQQAARSVYGLNEREPGIDVWRYSREYERFLPFVDTVYGSAAYLPMRDGARYEVVITEDGLVARIMRDDQPGMKSQ